MQICAICHRASEVLISYRCPECAGAYLRSSIEERTALMGQIKELDDGIKELSIGLLRFEKKIQYLCRCGAFFYSVSERQEHLSSHIATVKPPSQQRRRVDLSRFHKTEEV